MKERLPEKYLREMKELLGSQYEDYIESLSFPVHNGLRVNTLKITPEDLKSKIPVSLEKIPWIEDGFFYSSQDQPAKLPWYQAGLYYLQEPSAMTPADRLPIEAGDRVLDLCAAPGGKSTRLAAALKGTGMLYANDISSSRAKALLKNLEMFGAANICVMSEDPKKLAVHYPEYFDKILIDAPCSGEGMFHREMRMVRDWEEKGPDYYSPIQKNLLQQGFEMLKPGGMMMYSTCTFSKKENEENISWILEQCKELTLVEIRTYEGFSKGLDSLDQCVRIFPQNMAGEGHFLALMKKKERNMQRNESQEKTVGKIPDAAEAFLAQINWRKKFRWEQIDQGVYGFSDEFIRKKKIRCLRTGLLAGTVKRERFEPSQALAMYLDCESFPQILSLPAEDPRVMKYLKGETLEVSDLTAKEGWHLVCLETYPLGWGKVQKTMLKNKRYSGWRVQ